MATPYTELNPNLPDQTQSFVRPTSEGFKASTSGASLIKDTGEVFSMGVKAVDEFFKASIQEEATKDVDQVRKEFGAEDAGAFQKNLSSQDVPSELQRAGQNLANLSTAVQQGTLKESHYYARLDSVARQLRAKYPGYREHIDNTIAGLVGTTPANRLVSELFEEAKRKGVGGATEQEKREYQYEKENEAYLPDGYRTAKAQGQALPFHLLQDFVASKKKASLNFDEREKQKAAVRKDSEDFNKITAEQARELVGSSVSQILIPIQPEIDKLVARAQGDVSTSGGISPGLAKEFETVMNNVRSTAVKAANGVLTRPTFATLPNAERQAILAGIDSRLEGLSIAFTDKNFGLMGSMSRQIQNMTEGASGILIADEANLLLAAARKLYGDSFVNTIALKSGLVENPDKIKQQLQEIAALKLTLGRVTPGNAITDMTNKGFTPAQVRGIINIPLNALLDAKTAPSAKQAIVNNYFGTPRDAEAILGAARTREDRRTIFNDFTRPDVTRAIVKIGSETGNSEYLTNYSNWAQKAFITMSQLELGDLQKLHTNENVKVSYDPKAYKFTAIYDQVIPGLAPPGPASLAISIQSMVDRANAKNLAGINRAIQHMVPVWKELNLDPNKEIESIMRSYGMDTTKQPSGFKSLLKMMGEGFRTPNVPKGIGVEGTTVEPLRLVQGSATLDQGKLTKEDIESLSKELDGIFKEVEKEGFAGLDSLAGIVNFLRTKGYTPGGRESTNVEDVRDGTSPPNVGKFAAPDLLPNADKLNLMKISDERFDKFYPPQTYETEGVSEGDRDRTSHIKPGTMFFQGSGFTREEEIEYSNYMNARGDEERKKYRLSPSLRKKTDDWMDRMQKELDEYRAKRAKANAGS